MTILLCRPGGLDQRGPLRLSDEPATVLPGYRMPELPGYLADQMVQALDTYDASRGPIVWALDADDSLPWDGPLTVCGQTERLLARVSKCAIRADDGSLWWRVLVESTTGLALVAGSHFNVIRPHG